MWAIGFAPLSPMTNPVNWIFIVLLGLSFCFLSWPGVVLVCLAIFLHVYQTRQNAERLKSEFARSFYRDLPAPLILGGQSPIELGNAVSQLWAEHEWVLGTLSTIREGVMAVDTYRNIVLINQAANLILGYSEESTTKSLDTVQLPEIVLAAIEDALDGRVFDGLWKKGVKPDRKYYGLLAVPSEGQKGCVLVIRDLTKVKRLERVRRDFIANISHELRTPVTIVRSNAETLLGGAMDDPVYGPKFASAILRNGERLSRLINELLDLSRIEAGHYTMIIRLQKIRPVVEQVIAAMQTHLNEGEHQLILDIKPDICAAFDDRSLEQILSNYIDNAIKYAAKDSPLLIVIRAFLKDNTVCIEVEDDGIGIAEKNHPRVFERFFRVDKGRSREAGGTGLGLSIVKHLSEAMYGTVGVYSNAKGGSTFWCILPKTVHTQKFDDVID